MENGSKCVFTMSDIKKISIADYTYDLPAERIALHPATERDASKLLIYQNGKISQDIYKNIAAHLQSNSLLIFNNTKVIRARILFHKPTGGIIEIFCLEPFEDVNEYSTIMNRREKVKWKCMIGGAGKWKEGILSGEWGVARKKGEAGTGRSSGKITLNAKLTEKLSDAYVVEFSWQPGDLTFAEVLEATGDIPLPPYIKRRTDDTDPERYQTIYAKDEGSVAAPTAGLHFTENIFESLGKKNIQTDFVTLHVGAGTFKPVKSATMEGHEMHAEWIDVSIELIENLIDNIGKMIVAVGTTSLRTIESLYWMGVKAINPFTKDLTIHQWDAYEPALREKNISAKDALIILRNWMAKNDLDRIFIQTQILILPGYQFKIAKAIVTNFHQPQSTLLLLVAAAIGEDWRKVYDHAMKNDFRFLSYGDGSLLFIAGS